MKKIQTDQLELLTLSIRSHLNAFGIETTNVDRDAISENLERFFKDGLDIEVVNTDCPCKTHVAQTNGDTKHV